VFLLGHLKSQRARLLITLDECVDPLRHVDVRAYPSPPELQDSVWLLAEDGGRWSLGSTCYRRKSAHGEEAHPLVTIVERDLGKRGDHIRGGDIAENGGRSTAYRNLRRAEQCGKVRNRFGRVPGLAGAGHILARMVTSSSRLRWAKGPRSSQLTPLDPPNFEAWSCVSASQYLLDIRCDR